MLASSNKLPYGHVAESGRRSAQSPRLRELQARPLEQPVCVRSARDEGDPRRPLVPDAVRHFPVIGRRLVPSKPNRDQHGLECAARQPLAAALLVLRKVRVTVMGSALKPPHLLARAPRSSMIALGSGV